MFRFINRFLQFFGISLQILFRNVQGIPHYLNSLYLLIKQKGNSEVFPLGRLYPILHERTETAGVMNGHYFHQDLLVAQRIYELNPKIHVDIGSRTDGFIAHLAVFREVILMDIRAMQSNVKNIKFKQANLMELPVDMIDYCDSISSLHAIEHFGLGRYGDPIDYMGYKKALDTITTMLKTDGVFHFSVPIGKQRIEFNAHRVFSVAYLVSILTPAYDIARFSYVDDMGNLHTDVILDTHQCDISFGCNYGCGIFELVKR